MQVGEEDCCPPGSRRRSGLPAGAIVQVFVQVFVQVIVQVIVQVFESTNARKGSGPTDDTCWQAL